MVKTESDLEILDIDDGSVLLDELNDLSALNCKFFFQKGDDANATHSSTLMHGPITLFSVMNQSDEIKKRLIALFEEFCNVLESAGETADSIKRRITPPRRNRDAEIKWMENNKDLLARLARKWIAVEGDQLVAESEEFTLVLEAARAKGITVPFIIYLPQPTSDFSIGI
jgi:hypothetical protein